MGQDQNQKKILDWTLRWLQSDHKTSPEIKLKKEKKNYEKLNNSISEIKTHWNDGIKSTWILLYSMTMKLYSEWKTEIKFLTNFHYNEAAVMYLLLLNTWL